MKTDISFKDGGSKTPLKDVSIFDEYSDWLVELTSLDHPEISVVEIVFARCYDEAVYNAFWTRNIASSWKITEVEEA